VDDRHLEIAFQSKSGVTITAKADTQQNKAMWVKAFQTQVDLVASQSSSAAWLIPAEERALALPLLPPGSNVAIPSVAVREGKRLSRRMSEESKHSIRGDAIS
jgi:hypothetical protein